MPLTSTISEDGKVAIPDAIREGFHLLPGQTLFWSIGDGSSWIVSLSDEEERRIGREAALAPFSGCIDDETWASAKKTLEEFEIIDQEDWK